MADGRGSSRPLEDLRRDPQRPLVLRTQPLRRCGGSCSTSGVARLPGAPPPLRFGSWIGGDMDGNPSAGVATIEEARARPHARARALPRACARPRRRAFVPQVVRPRDGGVRAIARARPARAAGVRSGDRRAERARAVPAEAFLHVVAARERSLRVGRLAVGRSRRHPPQPRGEPRHAGCISCRGARADRRASSASTSRSSTCACTPASSRQSASARLSAPSVDTVIVSQTSSAEDVLRALSLAGPAPRSCRSSRRSTISRQRRASSRSCSATSGSRVAATRWR